MIIGSNITANRACTTFVNDMTITSMSTCSGCYVGVSTNGLLVPIAGGGGGGSSAVIISGTGVNSSVRCGVSNDTLGNCSASLGGSKNLATKDFSTIVGGYCNLIDSNGRNSFIGGGSGNTVSECFSFIGGGKLNVVYTYAGFATISGGRSNSVSLSYSTIGGGYKNCARARATVSGGFYNCACGNGGFIGGGCQNSATGGDLQIFRLYNMQVFLCRSCEIQS